MMKLETLDTEVNRALLVRIFPSLPTQQFPGVRYRVLAARNLGERYFGLRIHSVGQSVAQFARERPGLSAQQHSGGL